MKNVNIQRFLGKKPEKINFQPTPIPDSPEPGKPEIEEEVHQDKRSNEPSDERTNERSQIGLEKTKKERTYSIVIPHIRKKSRQSFDVFEDQKHALDTLQFVLHEAEHGKKPKLGDMVQEALDSYIKSKSRELTSIKLTIETGKKENERSNERPNERAFQQSEKSE